MRKRDEVKASHERAVAGKLLEALKIDATFERQGNPDRGEPDLIYRVGGKTVGIEVTTAYYEDSDGKDTAEIAANERPLRPNEIRPRSGGIIGEPDQMICKSVQEAIDKKCGKTYSGTDETWLCVEQDAPLSDSASTAECAKNLEVPQKSPFGKIYLMS